MTFDEYLNIINDKNEWHEEGAYDFSLSSGKRDYHINIVKLKATSELVRQKEIGNIKVDFYLTIEKSTFGYFENPEAEDYKEKNWINYTEVEKKEKGLPLNNYEVKAIHKEEELLIGAGQDEWGCVLIWTLDEYRGMGIGEEIIKIYREYYPSRTSGGFTTFGYNQIKKYHASIVNKYLSNGIYSDMVKKGEITTKRVREITDSIKSVKKFTSGKESTNPLVKYYGNTTNNIYIGDNYVVIYDNKLLQKNNVELDYSLHDLVYDKTIKAFISFRYHGDGFNDLYAVYSSNETDFKYAMEFILSMCPDGLSNKFFRHNKTSYGIKELDWVKKYIKSGEYSLYKFEKYKDIEYYDIIKIKKPIPNIEILKKITHKNLKKIDPYEEGFNIMIEEAESKWVEYAENNIAEYLYTVAIGKIKELSGDPEWFKKNITRHHFNMYFKSYYDEEEWEELDGNKSSEFLLKANIEFDEIMKKYKIYKA